MAWTLVEFREGRWFWDEIGGKRGGASASVGPVGNAENVGRGRIVRERGRKVEKIQIKIDGQWEGEDGKKSYESALAQLGGEVGGDR
jgi:hypothetical protein